MNILLTTDYFPPHIGGGVEVVVYRLATELVRLGHRVAVITLNTRHVKSQEILNGVRVYRANPIEFTQSIGAQSAISLEALSLIRNVCRKERVNIVHANSIFFFTTIAACANKIIAKTPVVTTLHGGSMSELEGALGIFTNLYERSVGKWILRTSNHLTAVSQVVMKHAETLGAPRWKISVIPNAVDVQEFNPRPHVGKKQGVTVAFVGRLLSNKGPQFLVEAAPAIVREFSPVRFLIVGEGPMLNHLRERVSKLGLNKQFDFLGMVPSVAQFLRNCDIYVRPSLSEGMPLTILEAMACGLPTVASDVAGTSEIVCPGKTGFLIEPKNTGQLAFYILKLLKDEKLRSSMGRTARSIVEKSYGWGGVALQMSKLYGSILEQ